MIHNKSGKIRSQADPTSVEIAQDNLKLGLVVCVASTCLYALPTTSGHAPEEMTDVLLRDLLPDLDQGISQLLDSLWCDVESVDGTRHDDPEVLNWI